VVSDVDEGDVDNLLHRAVRTPSSVDPGMLAEELAQPSDFEDSDDEQTKQVQLLFIAVIAAKLQRYASCIGGRAWRLCGTSLQAAGFEAFCLTPCLAGPGPADASGPPRG
jgi:hypothetical protein